MTIEYNCEERESFMPFGLNPWSNGMTIEYSSFTFKNINYAVLILVLMEWR